MLEMRTSDGENEMELVKYGNHSMSDQWVVKFFRISTNTDLEVDLERPLREKDIRLLYEKAKSDHRNPFYHPTVTLEITCPIAVARQWFRHTVGMAYSEQSGRYALTLGTYWVPEKWEQETLDLFRETCEQALSTYNQLLSQGVKREQARMVLPLGIFTRFYATGTLYAWFHWWHLRSDSSAQAEHRVYATLVDEVISPCYPHAWGALKASVG